MVKQVERHIILREAYRRISSLAALARESAPAPAEGRIGGTDKAINAQESGLSDSIELNDIELNYFDLMAALRSIRDTVPERKRQAFWLNVILDMKQKDVADKLQVSPVTVGQHVTSVCKALEEAYFAD